MTCIVSAYYKIPSKQTHEWYMPHLIRWFRSVGTAPNVHFFTTEEIRDEIKTIVDTGAVVFHILPFNELTALTRWGHEFWERQYARDTERYHSPELGMIWYEKRHFVRRVMEIDCSKVFIWCDAGCVRDDATEEKARTFGRRTTIRDDRIHLQRVMHQVFKQFYAHPDICVAGAILAGSKSAWTRYNVLYDRSLAEYDNAAVSGISDQYVTLRCVAHSPDAFMFHSEPSIVDPWFKFLELL